MRLPILNGMVYSQFLDGWQISWESAGHYRHWCYQEKDSGWENLIVVMFNPGSLSGDGANLRRDTTLRILREVCGPARLNPYIINLFDYACPSPQQLFNDWSSRDAHDTVFDRLALDQFDYVIMAYGDYENGGQYEDDIKERIHRVRESLQTLEEIDLPRNKSGTPKHPLIWQRQKLKPDITQRLSRKRICYNQSTSQS